MNLNDFFFNIQKIKIAHDCTIKAKNMYNEKNICSAYQFGRGLCGIVLAISGQAEFSFPKKTYLLNPGDIVFIPESAAYSLTPLNNFRHYTVNFNLDKKVKDIVCLQKYFENDDIFITHPSTPTNYATLLENLCQTWKQKAFGYELQSMAYLYDLLYLLFFDSTFATKESTTSAQNLLKARDYIFRYWNKSLSLTELSEQCNMSVSTFRHLFRATFQQSPMQFINDVKIEHAKDYLLSGFYTVTEVAEYCGFIDVNYFSRFFKNKVGLSPLQFKNIMRSRN